MTTKRCLSRVTGYLGAIIPGMLVKQLDPERVARVGVAVRLRRVKSSADMLQDAAKYLLGTQQPDGGWSNVEETVWSLHFLRQLNDPLCLEPFSRGLSWLASERHSGGGWGQSRRDQPRIPLTGLVLALVPELGEDQAKEWLRQAAVAEISAPRVLSYKLAIPLMVFAADPEYSRSDLCGRLVTALCAEQNPDGGFAPWRGHPVGSEVWSTAFAVIGLARAGALLGKSNSLNRAVAWLEKTQLEDGSWPYHYVDEGAALGCWALVEALSAD